ncbi:MAG: hypothetical protein K2J80_02270 [Oscillospiraceae bacterium]|nr:hypothetical protein [Oscillospiraceae bacterium]
MNNKDLFDAINNIDEKIIADAGKYLKKDAADPSRLSEPVEICPAEIRLTPLKIISPIVAAAVLVVGVAVTFKVWKNSISSAPLAGTETAMGAADGSAADYDTASAVLDAPGVSGAGASSVTENDHAATDPTWTMNSAPTAVSTVSEVSNNIIKNNKTGELSFYIYGPDFRNLTYDDITAIRGDDTADTELTERNWSEIICENFAYLTEPTGDNRNSIDNQNLNEDLRNELDKLNAEMSAERDYRRLYAGDDFNGLTVAEASSSFVRSDSTDVPTLSRNYVRFDGEIIENVYIVKSGDKYHLVFGNDFRRIPLMNIVPLDMAEGDESGRKYGTRLESFTAGEFQYIGELPPLELERNDIVTEKLDEFFTAVNYQKATVALSDISVEFVDGKYSIRANVSHCILQCWESLTEPPFDSSDIDYLMHTIAPALTVEELKARMYYVIHEICPYDNIKVYSDIDEMHTGTDIYDGGLKPGMIAALYDADGKLVYALIYKMNQIL